MTTQAPPGSLLPLSPQQLAKLQAATSDLSLAQLAWVSGYFWGMVNQTPDSLSQTVDSTDSLPAGVSLVTVLAASQTGNARRVAEQLRDDLQAAQLNVKLINAADYKFKQIGQEKLLIVITSTQVEGDPPEEAVALYKFLMSKKAPKMENSAFAVFGLGDTSYPFFSKTGKDFDQRLAELGAERLLERVDADVEYASLAARWREQLVGLLRARLAANTQELTPAIATGILNRALPAEYSKVTPLTASIAANQKITGRGSDKDVRHIEIDLGNSGLRYQPGDALGVWYENDTDLVAEVIELAGLTGDELVETGQKTLPLSQALCHHFELTVNTPQIVEQYAKLSDSQILQQCTAERGGLQQYAKQMPIVDMFRAAPAKLEPQQLTAMLRPLTPRLYSIASSQAETDNEVHITVGVVRYEVEGRARAGGASSYLAYRLEEEGSIRIFIEHNDNFRLPADSDAPIIMIGPGTGVAPFRAFMQQRDNEGATGKNWLFFGNPHFTEDFLYQTEWQRYVQAGLLTNIDLAWSRDQQNKVYVQDKLREKGAEIWRWIEQGAHIYVCGDANHMAKDVEQALLQVVAKHGAMDIDSADEFLSELRVERRYQRDVY